MLLGAGCCSDELAVSLRARQGRLILCGPEVVASWLVRTDRTISADIAGLRQDEAMYPPAAWEKGRKHQ